MAALEGFEHLESPEVQDSEVNSINGPGDLASEVYGPSVAMSFQRGQEDPDEDGRYDNEVRHGAVHSIWPNLS